MICQWHLVKKFGCKFSLSMACSHWPTIWLSKGGWGGGGGYGWFGLGKNFFPNLWWQNFFPDIQQCKILFPTLHAHYIFSVGIFFFCQLFLATFFSLTISLQDIFPWNHPYPLLKVKWSIPNPNWPHCCQCSMLTCSVLTRPQHCGIAALPKGSQRRKERKQTYRVFSHDVTVAILVSQNNETAAMLVSQTNPVGVGLFSYAKTFFCSNKFA